MSSNYNYYQSTVLSTSEQSGIDADNDLLDEPHSNTGYSRSAAVQAFQSTTQERHAAS